MAIVIAFVLTAFIVSGGLVLLKYDCGQDFDGVFGSEWDE